MTRYLEVPEVLELHRIVLEQWGGTGGVRDAGALESALGQPRVTFGTVELYPDVVTKATALCYSLVRNHPFVDGNKRVGHAAMEVFLVLNGYELAAPVEEQERLMLRLADGRLERDELAAWVREHLRPLNETAT